MKQNLFHSLGKTMLVIVLAAVVGVQLAGCSDSDEGQLKENLPPSIWLSAAPPEGSLESYVIKMHWGGFDPDGNVAYYEYCITDNDRGSFDPADTVGADAWSRVYSNDSTFSFTADELVDTNTTEMITEFERSHTFFIRAVDNAGLPSLDPAYRSFSAFTLSPFIHVNIPVQYGQEPAKVPAITTFRWVAEDYISNLSETQDPDSVSWLFEPRANHNDSWEDAIAWLRDLPLDSREWNKFGGWKWYGAPEDSGRFWTTPPQPIGNFLFAIRAKDEAGAITPVFDERHNIRRILVSKRNTGPTFAVSNEYMGSVRTSSINTPITIIDLPAGVPLRFCFEATALDYGGTVVGYRYGWDIKDLTIDDQWDVGWTPFPPPGQGEIPHACASFDPFYWGVHVFTIEVTDNSGYASRVEVKVNIVDFTMGKPLLLVDDFEEGEQGGWYNLMGRGVLPNDLEHDQFWEDMLSEVTNFTPTATTAGGDIMEVSHGDFIVLPEFADYKSVIWSANGHIDQQSEEAPVLFDLIRFRPPGGDQGGGGKRQPNLIALFMAAGGQMMFCGNHPVSQSIDQTYCAGLRYPVILRYEQNFAFGGQDDPPDPDYPCCDGSFSYNYLCLETMEFALCTIRRRRTTGLLCDIYDERRCPVTGLRDHTMRSGIPVDPYYTFPAIGLRPETAGPGRYHAPESRGLDTEVYNAEYFIDLCGFAQNPRSCFTPIYGLGCLDINEPVYEQPVAFWTSAFADEQTNTHRSVVFGFPPVMFNPDEIRGALEIILFDEWNITREQ